MYEPATASTRLARRATHAVLDAITRTPDLRESYVLKGGLALHLAYGSPRVSLDIDLNAVDPTERAITAETGRLLLEFSRRLDDALESVRSEYRFAAFTVQNDVLSSELPTLMTEIAYESDDGLEGVVKLQLTLSDLICATVRRTVRGLRLHVATLEDILADKLKALLQQVTRDKVRSSDVFDVWYFADVSPIPLDPAVLSSFLKRKCGPNDVMPPLAKNQFRRKSVVAYASAEFDQLAALLPPTFELPPFRDVYEKMLAFVDSLDLPLRPEE